MDIKNLQFSIDFTKISCWKLPGPIFFLYLSHQYFFYKSWQHNLHTPSLPHTVKWLFPKDCNKNKNYNKLNKWKTHANNKFIYLKKKPTCHQLHLINIITMYFTCVFQISKINHEYPNNSVIHVSTCRSITSDLFFIFRMQE